MFVLRLLVLLFSGGSYLVCGFCNVIFFYLGSFDFYFVVVSLLGAIYMKF